MGNDPANWLVLGIGVAFISFFVWVQASSKREQKKSGQEEVKNDPEKIDKNL